VPEDFSTLVPVEVQTPGKRAQLQWIRTSDDAAAFSADVAATPVKVVLDPGGNILRQ
jgi:hypothetical protein